MIVDFLIWILLYFIHTYIFLEHATLWFWFVRAILLDDIGNWSSSPNGTGPRLHDYSRNEFLEVTLSWRTCCLSLVYIPLCWFFSSFFVVHSSTENLSRIRRTNSKSWNLSSNANNKAKRTTLNLSNSELKYCFPE